MGLLERLKSSLARTVDGFVPPNLLAHGRSALAVTVPIRSKRGISTTKIHDKVTLETLIELHFAEHASVDHPNRASITRALKLLGGNPARILETGSSAWGINSSRLFDSYVTRFGGSFQTIDIRSAAGRRLRPVVGAQTELIVGDSVKGIKWVADRTSSPFDLVYLDSFDLDVNDPIPSMIHGLAEFLWLEKVIGPGSLILIDDTPRDDQEWQRVSGTFERIARTSPIGEYVPGTGALVAKFLDHSQFDVISHDYQLLLRKR